jgi:hypothetical protein
MLGLDLSLIISFGTLLVTFFNVYQVYSLNIEFHKKSKVYDKKFEVLIELEELCIMHYVRLNDLLFLLSNYPQIEHNKHIDQYSGVMNAYKLKVRINKKMLKDTIIEDKLHKASGEALIDIMLYISGNFEDNEKNNFSKTLYNKVEKINVICEDLLTKYHNLKNS